MNIKNILAILFLKIYCTTCNVLLLSNKKIDINPLQTFTDDELASLVEKMDLTRVVTFKHPTKHIPQKFKELINGGFSAYNTNDNLQSINITDLSGHEPSDFLKIKSELHSNKDGNQNVLILIISAPDKRFKRKVDEDEDNETADSKGSVTYIGKSNSDDSYGLIYSSSPLVLRINNTDTFLHKTSPDMISVDNFKLGETIVTRLMVKIPSEDGTTLLRFIFSWINQYWYLNSVQLQPSVTKRPVTEYNLSIDKEISAAAKFSYHCPGSMLFSNSTYQISLLLTDMQVQIQAEKESFGDAYDCIPFTTVPIWSGIFVSSLLVTVLMISIVALSDIKTMDKFDNHKTKQLSITVSE